MPPPAAAPHRLTTPVQRAVPQHAQEHAQTRRAYDGNGDPMHASSA